MDLCVQPRSAMTAVFHRVFARRIRHKMGLAYSDMMGLAYSFR